MISLIYGPAPFYLDSSNGWVSRARYKMSCLVATYLLGELLSLGLNILDRTGLINKSANTTSNLYMCAYHVECRLGQVIVCTRKNLLERADSVLQRHELAFVTREDLCDLEGL
jgi:hypothetical protein